MKSDKILDKCVKLSIADIIADKIEREDKEANWIPGITKKRKMKWVREVYLSQKRTEFRQLVEKISIEVQKDIRED